MKRLKKIHSLFLLVLLVFMYSCGEQTSGEEATRQAEVEAPEQIISLAEAKTMFDNYSERRAAMIQKFEDSVNISKKDTAKFDVARYTYYDLKTIKQYIAYIEQEAAKAKVEISTLRFYYSNYPDQEKFPNGQSIEHPRQNSIFILPTLNQDGNEFGFYTEDDGEGGMRAVLFDWQLQEFNKEMGMMNTQGKKAYAGFAPNVNSANSALNYGNGSLVLNQGGASPPPYQ